MRDRSHSTTLRMESVMVGASRFINVRCGQIRGRYNSATCMMLSLSYVHSLSVAENCPVGADSSISALMFIRVTAAQLCHTLTAVYA